MGTKEDKGPMIMSALPTAHAPTKHKRVKRSLDAQKADLERRITDRDLGAIVDSAIDALRLAKATKHWSHARKIADELGVAICERAGDGETDYAMAAAEPCADEESGRD